MKTKVFLVSGFLGAGKTTFLQKYLAAMSPSKHGPTVVLENDFGDVAFDAGLVRSGNINVMELSQGCICCSLAGDFVKALSEIARDYKPGTLWIEPSGLGNLSEIKQALTKEAIRDIYQLERAFTIIDARHFRKYLRNFRDFYTDQIQAAGDLILNRTSAVSEEEIRKIQAKLAELNPRANRQVMDLVQVTSSDLVNYVESVPAGPTREADQSTWNSVPSCRPAKAGFVSLNLNLNRRFCPEEVRRFLSELTHRAPDTVVRAKGWIELSDGTCCRVQYTPPAWEVEVQNTVSPQLSLNLIVRADRVTSFRQIVSQVLNGLRQGVTD